MSDAPNGGTDVPCLTIFDLKRTLRQRSGCKARNWIILACCGMQICVMKTANGISISSTVAQNGRNYWITARMNTNRENIC